MSIYGKRLYIRKNGSIQGITLYTTPEETQNNYICIRDGSSLLYAALGSTNNASASWLQVRKSGSVYAVLIQAIDMYSITGRVTGSYKETTYNCTKSDCSSPDQCNCQCSHNLLDYRYQISLSFTGVTKFPIKYTSKTGAIVQIAQSQVSGSGSTYTYTSGWIGEDNAGKNNEQFNPGEINSLFPSSGVSNWSAVSSINIGSTDAGCYASASAAASTSG